MSDEAADTMPAPDPDLAAPGGARREDPPVAAVRERAPVKVTEVTEVTPELVEAFDRLVPQLSNSNPPPSHSDLVEMATSPASVLLVARNVAGGVIGSLTLALFRLPTGVRAWIEDVVVDESARGAGAGEALVMDALRRAAEAGARTVDLTSRPSREAANRLYVRLGFEARTTNVYRRTVELPTGES